MHSNIISIIQSQIHNSSANASAIFNLTFILCALCYEGFFILCVHCAHGFWHFHCEKWCAVVGPKSDVRSLFFLRPFECECASVANQDLISECLPLLKVDTITHAARKIVGRSQSKYQTLKHFKVQYVKFWMRKDQVMVLANVNVRFICGQCGKVFTEQKGATFWITNVFFCHKADTAGEKKGQVEPGLADIYRYRSSIWKSASSSFYLFPYWSHSEFLSPGWDCTETSGATSDRKQRGGQTSD